MSHCSVAYGWSADSRNFMTASLAPRMNVDNNVKVFKYNGYGPIANFSFERAYDATWRPMKSGIFPNRGPSPKRGDSKDAPVSAAVPAKPAAAPYRPPSARGGSTSNFMQREAAPVGKVKGGTAGAPTSSGIRTGSAPARKIPGMPPPAAPATGIVNNRVNDILRLQLNCTASKKSTSSSSNSGSSNSSSTAVTEDKAKRVKNLNKKLKQIEEIKEKQKSGQELNADQVKSLFSYAVGNKS